MHLRVAVSNTAPAGRPPSGDVDDAQLAQALARREAWAETAAWNRYWPLVYGLCCRTLGSAHAGEDLAQEVFFRLFLKVPSLRDPAALRSFIVSITYRVLKWELRRRQVRRWVTLSASGEPPDTLTVVQDPIARVRLRRLYAVLDRLSPDERTLFVLRHMEGFTLEEVAKAVGVSLATVKRRLARTTHRVSQLVAHDPELASLSKEMGGLDGA